MKGNEMNKIEITNKLEEIKTLIEKEGVGVRWVMGNKEIVMKKNGSIKLYFSLRNEKELEKEIEVVKRNCIKILGNEVKFRGCNMLNSYRSQYYVICTI